MEIKYHGNTCFTFKSKIGNIVINPDEQAGKLKGEIVLSSLLDGLKEVEEQEKVFDWPGEFEVKGLPIIAFQAYNKSRTEEEGEGDDASPTIIFHFEIDKIKCCHMGDLGHALKSEILKELSDVDVLMIGAGGKSNLSLKKADEMIEAIDPRVLIPMGEDMTELLKSRGLEKNEPEKKFTIKSGQLPEEDRIEVRLEKR